MMVGCALVLRGSVLAGSLGDPHWEHILVPSITGAPHRSQYAGRPPFALPIVTRAILS
jgi:hypothetical protein